MRDKNIPCAEVLCRQALEESPEDPECLILMALVCFNASQFDHAVEWAARAIRIDPRPDYLTTLGTALLNVGRHDEAVAVLDKAVQLKPGDAGLWSDLGDALVAVGRAPEAALCFKRTLELDSQPDLRRRRPAHQDTEPRPAAGDAAGWPRNRTDRLRTETCARRRLCGAAGRDTIAISVLR
jgi:tetratricopeptide (TPR) repeat protein